MQLCSCFRPPRAISDHGSDTEHESSSSEGLDSEHAATAYTNEGHCVASISFPAAKPGSDCGSLEPAGGGIRVRLVVDDQYGEPRAQLLLTFAGTDIGSAVHADMMTTATNQTHKDHQILSNHPLANEQQPHEQQPAAPALVSCNSIQAAACMPAAGQHPPTVQQELHAATEAPTTECELYHASAAALISTQNTALPALDAVIKECCALVVDVGQTIASPVGSLTSPAEYTVAELKKLFEQHSHSEENSTVLATPSPKAAAQAKAASASAACIEEAATVTATGMAAAVGEASIDHTGTCTNSSRSQQDCAGEEEGSQATVKLASSMLGSNDQSSSTPCVWERVLSAARLQQLLDDRSTANVSAAALAAVETDSASSCAADISLQDSSSLAEACLQHPGRTTMLAPSDDDNTTAERNSLSDVLDAAAQHVEDPMPALELSEAGAVVACMSSIVDETACGTYLDAVHAGSRVSSHARLSCGSLSGSARRRITAISIASSGGHVPGCSPEDAHAAVRHQHKIKLTDQLLMQLADAAVAALMQHDQLQQLGPQAALLLGNLTNCQGSSGGGSMTSSSISSSGGGAGPHRGYSAISNSCAGSCGSSSIGGGGGGSAAAAAASNSVLRQHGSSINGTCADSLPGTGKLSSSQQQKLPHQQQQNAGNQASWALSTRSSSAGTVLTALVSASNRVSSSNSATSLGGSSSSSSNNEVLSAAQKARLLRQVSAALAAGISLDDLLQQCDDACGYSSRAVTKQLLMQQQGLLGTWSTPRGYSRVHGGSNGGRRINSRAGIGSCRLSASSSHTGGGDSSIGAAGSLTPAAAVAAAAGLGTFSQETQQQQQHRGEYSGQLTDVWHAVQVHAVQQQQQQQYQVKQLVPSLPWQGLGEQWETLRQQWQRQQLLKHQRTGSGGPTSRHVLDRDSHSSATTWGTWTTRTAANSMTGETLNVETPTAAAAAQPGNFEGMLDAEVFSQYSNQLCVSDITCDVLDEPTVLTVGNGVDNRGALDVQQQATLEETAASISTGTNPLFGVSSGGAGEQLVTLAAAKAVPASRGSHQTDIIVDGMACAARMTMVGAAANGDLLGASVHSSRSSASSAIATATATSSSPEQRRRGNGKGDRNAAAKHRWSSSCSRAGGNSNSYTAAAAAAASCSVLLPAAPRVTTRIHYCPACNPDGACSAADKSSRRSSVAYSSAPHSCNSSSAGVSSRNRSSSSSRGRGSRMPPARASGTSEVLNSAASAPPVAQDVDVAAAAATGTAAQPLTSSKACSITAAEGATMPAAAPAAAGSTVEQGLLKEQQGADLSSSSRSSAAVEGTAAAQPQTAGTVAPAGACPTLGVTESAPAVRPDTAGLTSLQQPQPDKAATASSYYRPRSPTPQGFKRMPGVARTTLTSSRPSSASSFCSSSSRSHSPSWKPAGSAKTSPMGTPMTSPRGAGKADAGSHSAGSRPGSPVVKLRAAAAAGIGSRNANMMPKPSATAAGSTAATATAAPATGRCQSPVPKLLTAAAAAAPKAIQRPHSPGKNSVRLETHSRTSSPAPKRAVTPLVAAARSGAVAAGSTCRPMSPATQASVAAAAAAVDVSGLPAVPSRPRSVTQQTESAAGSSLENKGEQGTPNHKAARTLGKQLPLHRSSKGRSKGSSSSQAIIPGRCVAGVQQSRAAARLGATAVEPTFEAKKDAEEVQSKLRTTAEHGRNTGTNINRIRPATAPATADKGSSASRGSGSSSSSSSLLTSPGAGSLQLSISSSMRSTHSAVKQATLTSGQAEVTPMWTSSSGVQMPVSFNKHLLLSPHSSGGGSDNASIAAAHPAVLHAANAVAAAALAVSAGCQYSNHKGLDPAARDATYAFKQQPSRSLSTAPPAVAGAAGKEAESRRCTGVSSSVSGRSGNKATVAAAAGHQSVSMHKNRPSSESSMESGSSPYASLGGSSYNSSSGGTCCAVGGGCSSSSTCGIGGVGRNNPSNSRTSRMKLKEAICVLKGAEKAADAGKLGINIARVMAACPDAAAAAASSRATRSSSCSPSRSLWRRESAEAPVTPAAAATAQVRPAKQRPAIIIRAARDFDGVDCLPPSGYGEGLEAASTAHVVGSTQPAAPAGGSNDAGSTTQESGAVPPSCSQQYNIHWEEDAVAKMHRYNPTAPPGGQKQAAQHRHSISSSSMSCGVGCATPAGMPKRHAVVDGKAATAAAMHDIEQHKQQLQHYAVVAQEDQHASAKSALEKSALLAGSLPLPQHMSRATFHNDATLSIVSISSPSLASVAENSTATSRLLETCPWDNVQGTMRAGSSGTPGTANSSCGGASNGAAAAGAVADGLTGILTLVKQLQGSLAGLESDMHHLHGVLHRPASRPCSVAGGSIILGVRKASQCSELLSELDGCGLGSRKPSNILAALHSRNNTPDGQTTTWKMQEGDLGPAVVATAAAGAIGGPATMPVMMPSHNIDLATACSDWRVACGRTASDVEKWVGGQLDEACQLDRQGSITFGGAGGCPALSPACAGNEGTAQEDSSL